MEILEVLYSPTTAFARLREKRWAWLIPAALTIALSLATVLATMGKFTVAEILEYQIERSGQEVPPGSMDQAVALVTATMYIAPIVFVPMMILVLAVLLLAIVKGFAGEASFPQMLNAVSLSMWALSVVSCAIMLLMLFTAPDLRAYNIDNPIPLNLAYFLGPEEVGKPFSALLSGINLLNFYYIYLLSLGASTLGSRVSMGKVMGPLLGLYFVWILAKAGFQALFG